MVRAISIYNFHDQSQHSLIDDIVTLTWISSDYVALAKSNQTICIYKLEENWDGNDECDQFYLNEQISSENMNLHKIFATIDDVKCLQYCNKGNYLLCLEYKTCDEQEINQRAEDSMNNDSLKTININYYVRIYTNWSKIQSNTFMQLKARIAGKVTPCVSDTNNDCLEMIELPMLEDGIMSPHVVHCCKDSGDIYICQENKIFIYQYQLRCLTKAQKYVDFELFQKCFNLEFIPESINVVDNYVVAMNRHCLLVFKMCEYGSGKPIQNRGKTGDDVKPIKSDNKYDVDFNSLNESEYLVEIESDMCGDGKKTSKSSQKNLDLTPVMLCDMGIVTETIRSYKSSTSANKEITKILQLHHSLQCISNVSSLFRHSSLFVLKEYTEEGSAKDKGCLVFVATEQEGFLYQFDGNIVFLIGKYSFTCTIIQASLNHSLLQALTENGIETYTIPLVTNNIQLARENDVLLVGLKRFIGISNFVTDGDKLILQECTPVQPNPNRSNEIGIIASTLLKFKQRQSSSTAQNTCNYVFHRLREPHVEELYHGFEEITNNFHSDCDVQLYGDLLLESHRLVNNYIRFEKHVSGEIIQLNIDSCLKLGDYYLRQANEHDNKHAIAFYKMANFKIFDIFNRLINAQQYANENSIKGLGLVLKYYVTLSDEDEIDEKCFSTPVKMKNESNVKFGYALFNFLVEYSPNDVSEFYLKSEIYREFLNDKYFEHLQSKKATYTIEENLCIVLYLLKNINDDSLKTAKDIIGSMEVSALKAKLIEYWSIMFDMINKNGTSKSDPNNFLNFSDFTEHILIRWNMEMIDVFIEVLMVLLLEMDVIHFGNILKLFLDFLSSSLENCHSVKNQQILQTFLERYFFNYFAGLKKELNIAQVEGLKILIRLYLSHLKMLSKQNDKTVSKMNTLTTEMKMKRIDEFFEIECVQQPDVTTVLFYDDRPKYLDFMPPFVDNILLYLNDQRETVEANNEAIQQVIVKLQSILCSQILHNDVIEEIVKFISNETEVEIVGSLSLLSIIYKQNKVTEMLLQYCPQSVLEYAKDHYTSNTEWNFLIENLMILIRLRDNNASSNDITVVFYSRVLKEILSYIANNMPLDVVLEILSSKDFSKTNYEDFQLCIRQTIDKERSDKLKQMLVSTGKQLLISLSKM